MEATTTTDDPVPRWNRRASPTPPTTEGRDLLALIEEYALAKTIMSLKAERGEVDDSYRATSQQSSEVYREICDALLSSPRVEEIEAAMLKYMVANNVGSSVLEILTVGSPYLRIPRDVLRDALASALSLPDGEGEQATRASGPTAPTDLLQLKERSP